MSTVINKTTLQVVEFANTPDYPESDWIVNPVLPPGVPLKYLKVDTSKASGDEIAEMTAEEKAAVDAAELPVLQKSAVASFCEAINAFIQERYPIEHQQSLSVLMTEAMFMGLKNRFAYVSQVWEWAKAAIAYYYSIVDQVSAAKSAAEINAIAFDFTNLISTDPLVTIRAVMNIPD